MFLKDMKIEHAFDLKMTGKNALGKFNKKTPKTKQKKNFEKYIAFINNMSLLYPNSGPAGK